MRLTPRLAARFARIALGHVTREYPHKLDHSMAGDADVRRPSDLHPIFFGSYDWHSCVHGWWLLLSIARLYRTLPEAAAIRALAETTFTPEKVAAEVAYLNRPGAAGFERPYGWAWLLTLHHEATRHGTIGRTLQPLAQAFATRFRDYLPRATYPVRTGSHANTAFAVLLAYDWAEANDRELALALTEKARDWYGGDRDAQAWEPDGDAFLSPVLTEAHCMMRLLPGREFDLWFADFLPRLDISEPPALFEPVFVSDRSDGKIAHLDGLNFSRAWSWRALGRYLPLAHPAHTSAERHLAAALPHVEGDYMGEHWLASFALLALHPDS